MFKSFNLGKLFGIDIFIHATFWLLPGMILLGDLWRGSSPDEIIWELLFIFAVFGCIVLHEVGHALAARGYGIGTRHITLYPIGGVAALERMPEKPGREIAIALAGPAVNLIIAAALFAVLMADVVLLSSPMSQLSHNPLENFAANVLWANVFLCLFNLLPCFPMDGGRVLRAVLALRMSRPRATSIAVGVGTVVAVGLLILGLAVKQPFLVILAISVYLLGQAELGMVRMKERGRVVRDRLAGFFTPPEEEPVYEAPPATVKPPAPGFSGLAWDATRRIWVEWKNGVAVGPTPAAR